jgi:5'-deoxynucleotidase YfbR-like HD superfamily hydrolase
MRQRPVFEVAFQLSSITRFSRDHCLKEESVLEHVGFCLFYAYLICEKVSKTTLLDFGVVAKRIAVHDVEESVLGDIPNTTKYAAEGIKNALNAVEVAAVHAIAKKFDSYTLASDWTCAKDGLEGQIVKLADIASIVYKVWVEVNMLGNKSFVRVAREIQINMLRIDLQYMHHEVREAYNELMSFNYKTANEVI